METPPRCRAAAEGSTCPLWGTRSDVTFIGHDVSGVTDTLCMPPSAEASSMVAVYVAEYSFTPKGRSLISSYTKRFSKSVGLKACPSHMRAVSAPVFAECTRAEMISLDTPRLGSGAPPTFVTPSTSGPETGNKACRAPDSTGNESALGSLALKAAAPARYVRCSSIQYTFSLSMGWRPAMAVEFASPLA